MNMAAARVTGAKLLVGFGFLFVASLASAQALEDCLACHEENGAPTGCTDCHAMTDAGEKFYNTGKYAPEAKAAGHGGGH
jgi:hypothetical protein